MPKAVVCYVCGRQYGTHSFEIHLKQCKVLFLAREAEKRMYLLFLERLLFFIFLHIAPGERKPLPSEPNDAINVGKKASEMTAADLEQMNQMAADSFNTNIMSKCEYCGRTFMPEKLLIHNRSCTASNPAKRVGGSKPSEPQRPSTSSEKSPGVSLRGAASAVRASNELSRPQTSSQASSSPGTIAGSLGGSGGRAIRDSRKSLSDAETSLTNSIPELKNGKVDTIEVLTRRVDALEVSEAAMQRVIKELRDEIALLKQHQQR